MFARRLTTGVALATLIALASSAGAIQNAINAGRAAGKAVYIPPGNYTVTAHLIVNNVTLTGAGMWYSVLGGNGVGVFGNFAPDGEDMTGTINVDHNTILDSPYDAFGFVGDYIPNATPPAYAIDNVHINDDIVHNVGTFVFQLQSAGSNDTISHVVSTGTVGLDGTMACAYGITPTYGAGNSGWSGSECTFPPFNILSTSTSSVDFGLVNLNTQSPAQTVTITNPGPDPAPISSVHATNGFTETNNCPATLAVGASCTATVTITPTAVQQYTGTISVPSTTVSHLRLDISDNTAQGAPQIAEFEAFSN